MVQCLGASVGLYKDELCSYIRGLPGEDRCVLMARAPEFSCGPYLKALADPTRWGIVRELLGEELTVGGLVERLRVSQYNISKHLRILREAGIVETTKAGKFVQARITSGFRTRLSADSKTLNLGCCTFNFERE